MTKTSLVYKLVLYTIIIIAVCLEFYGGGNLQLGAIIYFTIQSNLLVALYLFLDIVSPGRKRMRYIFRGISLLAIIMTSIIYNFVLYKIYQDWGSLAYSFTRTVTHVIAPIGYIIDWILFDRHGYMRLRDVFIWLIYPFVYCLISMLVGLVTGLSIYSFFNFSMGNALVKLLQLFCIVIVICLSIVAIDKVLMKKRNQGYKPNRL